MARNAAGFDEFYDATVMRMLRYGYAVTGDLAVARDVVQSAYSRAWRDWKRLERRAPEIWVRRTVSRLAAERRTRIPRPATASVPPLVAALRRLPVRDRQALALHHLYGLGVTEIAGEAGVPEAAVAAWLSRGRGALAAQLNLEAHDVD